MTMYVEQERAINVFGDNNEGFKYGLFQSIDKHGICEYVEWFKTKKEMMRTIKKNKMILIN